MFNCQYRIQTLTRVLIASICLNFIGSLAQAQTPTAADPQFTRLLEAYPDHLKAIVNDELIWRDGTQMSVDAPNAISTKKSVDSTADGADPLKRPSIRDMLAIPYGLSTDPNDVPPQLDPGRARPSAFFLKMYGDCRRGETRKHLARVTWLPGKTRKSFLVTTVNGVHEKLAKVSTELSRLPNRFMKYLTPAAGTYNCRQIAGTKRLSAHSYGIAIDIAIKHSDYWRWSKPNAAGQRPYRNKIPMEIVRIFEAHGFIWGGRWRHYDTMHFEYRPELLPK